MQVFLVYSRCLAEECICFHESIKQLLQSYFWRTYFFPSSYIDKCKFSSSNVHVVLTAIESNCTEMSKGYDNMLVDFLHRKSFSYCYRPSIGVSSWNSGPVSGAKNTEIIGFVSVFKIFLNIKLLKFLITSLLLDRLLYLSKTFYIYVLKVQICFVNCKYIYTCVCVLLPLFYHLKTALFCEWYEIYVYVCIILGRVF